MGQDGRVEGQRGQSKLEVARVLRTKVEYIEGARALLVVAAREMTRARWRRWRLRTATATGALGETLKRLTAGCCGLRAGIGAAMWAVSQNYHGGMGCERSEESATMWREKSKVSADPLVRATLLHEDNDDMVAAVTRLAEGGNARAQCQIALYYQLRVCVERDLGRAVEWATRAAGQNVTIAQYLLGELYSDGSGVKRDFARAFYWYDRAAIQGLVGAMLKVCHGYKKCWVLGLEETKKMIIAEWMWRAARAGHAEAKVFVDKFPPTHADHCAEMWLKECVRSSVWWDRNRLAFDTAEALEWLGLGMARDENLAMHLHNDRAGGEATLADIRAMGRNPMRVIDECEVFASVRPLVNFRFAPW
jgi:TPR repeat protein